MATGRRAGMGAGKSFDLWRSLAMAALAFGTCGAAAQSASPADQPSTSSDSSSSRKSGHHLHVPTEDIPSPELTRAESEIERREYASAETTLRTLVEKDSANYVAWFDLGFVENALRKVDESIAAYRKSVAAKADVFEANLNLGLQLAKKHDPEAETFLRAATKLQPTARPDEGRYRAWISLGQVVERSKPEEALAAYREAARLQPKESEPYVYAGELLEQENRLADAEREYKHALASDSRSTDAATGLANIYMQGRRFPEAEEYLRKLLIEHSNSAPLHAQLGRVLAAEGKNDQAIDELQAAAKLAPGPEREARELADLYAAGGKHQLAEAAYRDLLKAHPEDAELHRRLGEALLPQKKFTEAQQEFLEAVKLKPDLGEAYGGLAFAAGENKDYALVIRALDARSKLMPEVAITYFMRASAYDHLREVKKAAASYHLFLENANGKYPDEEWQAKHRLIALEPRK